MRKFKMGLVTLVASAAVIVPAGSAVAGSSSSSSASDALIEVSDINTGVVVWTGDILSPEFGNVCVLNSNQIVALLSGTDQTCGNDNSKKAHKR